MPSPAEIYADKYDLEQKQKREREASRIAALERVAEVAARATKFCPDVDKHAGDPQDCGIWQCYEMRQALAELNRHAEDDESANMKLSARDSEVFINAISNPPEPKDALKKALRDRLQGGCTRERYRQIQLKLKKQYDEKNLLKGERDHFKAKSEALERWLRDFGFVPCSDESGEFWAKG